MKRELDSALNIESQLAGSGPNQVSPTQRQTQASSCVEVDVNTRCKRIKVIQVNGYIVYTRVKKFRLNSDKFVEDKKLNSFEEPKIHSLSSSAEKDQKSSAVETKIKESTAVENVTQRNPVGETATEERPVQESTMIENVTKGNVVVDTIAGDRQHAIQTIIEESPIVKTVIEGSPVVEILSRESQLMKSIIAESSLIEIVVEESPVVEMVTREIPVETLIEESQEVEKMLEDEPYCNFEMPMWIEEPMTEPGESLAEEGGGEGAPIVIAETSEVRNDLSGKATRCFARSVLKLKEVGPLESLDYELQDVENEVDPNLDREATAKGTPLTTPWKNLEMKMSKKIAMNKRPITVKELFDTGLLDGVSVVYLGSIKSQAFGLRGTIKDGGILCSCSLCNGCRVIPPSKFEIHACKQYRRAAQYICFENGKSLLEVLKACRSIPLHSLEATILSSISASPEEKTFTCKRCKEPFPINCLGQVGPLCNSCSESRKSQGSPTCRTDLRDSSSEPLLIAKSSRSSSVCISLQNKSRWKITRKSSEQNSMPKSPNYASVMSTQHKGPWKMKRKSSQPGLITKSSRSASACIPSQNKSRWKPTKMSTKQGLNSKSFKGASGRISSQNKSQWRITTKDQRLHKMVFEKGGLPDGTEVAYYARGQKLLEGLKKGFGIFCRCCNCEVSPSQFEAHAGWASRRKPYAYIYTSNGVSLHEYAISISRNRKFSANDSDGACVICNDGGNLLLCDGCPRAFHKECASLPSVPRGNWFCKYCKNKYEREKFVECNVNAVAAGRVSGVDPIEQINMRCIRIVKNIESDLSGCVLCWDSDFSPSGFGPRTIIFCDQCEKEFHVGCLRTHKMAELKELPKGKWFCCMDCTRVYSTLQKLLDRGSEKLPDSLLEVIRKKYAVKGLDVNVDVDVRWRLLSAKIASSETSLLLSQALAIFHDCFDPIIDSMSGLNLIPCMVYGKNIKGQEYGGMYCAVLTVNSSVVSAGMLRVFGREVAELPLVATSIGNQRKGYFQLLFSCIEKMLSFLNVGSIVLPAAEQAESIWMNKFGFTKIEPDQLSKYRRNCCQIVRFKGASMLQKVIPPCRIVNRIAEPTEVLE